MLVDSHCHLMGSHQTPAGTEAVLARARLAGVAGFIAVATDLEDCRQVLALAASRPDVQASLGVHPHEASSWTPDVAAALKSEKYRYLASPNGSASALVTRVRGAGYGQAGAALFGRAR